MNSRNTRELAGIGIGVALVLGSSWVWASANRPAHPPSMIACGEDCSGYDAGWNWAAETGLSEPVDCAGNSAAFVEGCVAYTSENEGDGENYSPREDGSV